MSLKDSWVDLGAAPLEMPDAGGPGAAAAAVVSSSVADVQIEVVAKKPKTPAPAPAAVAAPSASAASVDDTDDALSLIAASDAKAAAPPVAVTMSSITGTAAAATPAAAPAAASPTAAAGSVIGESFVVLPAGSPALVASASEIARMQAVAEPLKLVRKRSASDGEGSRSGDGSGSVSRGASNALLQSVVSLSAEEPVITPAPAPHTVIPDPAPAPAAASPALSPAKPAVATVEPTPAPAPATPAKSSPADASVSSAVAASPSSADIAVTVTVNAPAPAAIVTRAPSSASASVSAAGDEKATPASASSPAKPTASTPAPVSASAAALEADLAMALAISAADAQPKPNPKNPHMTLSPAAAAAAAGDVKAGASASPAKPDSAAAAKDAAAAEAARKANELASLELARKLANPLAIQQHIRELIQADVDELNLLPGYRAGVFYDEKRGVARVHAMVSVQNFGISKAQAALWNLDWARHVAVTMDFGTHYCAGLAPPRRVQSFQTRTGDNQQMNVEKFKDQIEYGLAGMVTLRLEKKLFSGATKAGGGGSGSAPWPPIIKPRPTQLSASQKAIAASKDGKSADSKDDKAGGSGAAPPLNKAGSSAGSAAAAPAVDPVVAAFQELCKHTGKDALDALHAMTASAKDKDAKKPEKPKALLPDAIAKELTATPEHQPAFYALCELLPELSQPLLWFALKQRNYEVGKAVNALLEGKSKSQLIEAMNAEYCPKPKALVAVKPKPAEPKETDKLVLGLMDLCPFVPIPIIKLALTKTKRNAEKAAAQLMDEPSLNKLFAEAEDAAEESARNPKAGPSVHAVLLKNGVDLEERARTNFLIRVLNLVESSIVACGMRCLMCDLALEYPSFKPVVCDKAECCKRYQELGMGFDLLSEIKACPEVVDLLICFASAACGNGKIEYVFPSKVSFFGDDGKEWNFLRSGHSAMDADTGDGYNVDNKATAIAGAPATYRRNRHGHAVVENGGAKTSHNDPARVQTCIDAIPKIAAMTKYQNTAELRKVLDHAHPLIYPFLVWLITTNRAYLRLLREKERFPGLTTPHQFVMVSSSSKREQMWQRAKDAIAAKHGEQNSSIYMFHGSPVGNWHSILRTGLKHSGAAGLGTSGAAIWMANDFNTSRAYCLRDGKEGGWKNSMFGKSIVCMAVLEVVNDKAKKVDATAAVNVIEDVSIISTRYFLVFSGQIPSLNVRAVNLQKRVFEL